MKILITGANGFLGSGLVRSAIQKNYDVMAISRDDNNIRHLLDRISFVKQTEDYLSYKTEILNFQPDAVIHFAWDGGNAYADVNSLKQFSVNIPMIVSLLSVFHNEKKKPFFIGLGSFSEYGNFTSSAHEYTKENPQTYYGLAKNQAKNITQMFCEKNDMDWCWVRPCYTYGENDVKTRVIPRVITSLLNNKTIELDDCSTIIDYLHVDDFSEGVLSLLECGKKIPDGVFNICSGREYVLKNLIDLIVQKIPEANPSLIKFNIKNLRDGFSKYHCGSNSKIKDVTGWSPSINIDEGLDKTITIMKGKS